MSRYVLDAPALMRILDDDVQVAADHGLVGPSALRSHALQLLHEAVLRGELSAREAMERHDRMTEVKIRLLGDRVSPRVAFQLAQELDEPSIGACEYIAVTRLQADALIALDPTLAALADGLVPLAGLDDLVR